MSLYVAFCFYWEQVLYFFRKMINVLNKRMFAYRLRILGLMFNLVIREKNSV